VYLKGGCLRFEFEHKHRKTLNIYYSFLKKKQFGLFEQRLSYEFFKQTYKLFKYSQETEKVDWLARRLRPLQTRSSLAVPGSTFNVHYLEQCPIKMRQKQDLIQLFQLLAYLKTRNDYKTGQLTSKYRHYKFTVREFANYVNASSKVNHYQLTRLVDFFNSLKQNLVIEFLSDKKYRMLVTIPDAGADKIGNQWIAEVWVLEDVFCYLDPFLFLDYFKKEKITADEFSVLFQIIQKFTVYNLSKEFNIPKFLDSYSSRLNGTRKKIIKKLFLDYLINLQEEGKIQNQVCFFLHAESSLKRFVNISDLSIDSMMEPFIVFEILQLTFES